MVGWRKSSSTFSCAVRYLMSVNFSDDATQRFFLRCETGELSLHEPCGEGCRFSFLVTASVAPRRITFSICALGGDIRRFTTDIQEVYRSLSGIAELVDEDGEAALSIVVIDRGRGRLAAKGNFPLLNVNQGPGIGGASWRLMSGSFFGFEFDQTFLPAVWRWFDDQLTRLQVDCTNPYPPEMFLT